MEPARRGGAGEARPSTGWPATSAIELVVTGATSELLSLVALAVMLSARHMARQGAQADDEQRMEASATMNCATVSPGTRKGHRRSRSLSEMRQEDYFAPAEGAIDSMDLVSPGFSLRLGEVLGTPEQQSQKLPLHLPPGGGKLVRQPSVAFDDVGDDDDKLTEDVLRETFSEDPQPPVRVLSKQASRKSRKSLVKTDRGTGGAGPAAAAAPGSPARELPADTLDSQPTEAPSQAPDCIVVSEGDETSEEPEKVVPSPLELPEMVSETQRHCWAAVTADHFKVRSANYPADGVKEPSATESQLLAMELFRSELGKPITNVAGRASAPTATIAERCGRPLHSIFVVTLIIPTGGYNVQVTLYFGLYEGFEERCPSGARLLERFCIGDDAFRDDHFKIIPKINEGPFMLKLACPSRPGISGRTMKQHYFSGPLYYEVDMIVDSPVANRAIYIAKPISKTLSLDLAFLIEGRREDELPEVLLGCARISHISLDNKDVPLYQPP